MSVRGAHVLTVGGDAIELVPLGPEHLADVFALYSDPRVWRHLPSGRHTDEAQSRTVIDRAEESRRQTGLGAWALLERATGRFAGTAGVDLAELGVWNLGYRLHPDFHGRGLATAAALDALEAARAARPDAAVIARVVESNPASIRVLERVGLAQVWRGAVAAHDGSALQRRVYADRALAGDLLQALIALG